MFAMNTVNANVTENMYLALWVREESSSYVSGVNQKGPMDLLELTVAATS